jgi:hypothetical protein
MDKVQKPSEAELGSIVLNLVDLSYFVFGNVIGRYSF